jgi:hypothetical protein
MSSANRVLQATTLHDSTRLAVVQHLNDEVVECRVVKPSGFRSSQSVDPAAVIRVTASLPGGSDDGDTRTHAGPP